MLGHEKLDVYRCALRLQRWSFRSCRSSHEDTPSLPTLFGSSCGNAQQNVPLMLNGNEDAHAHEDEDVHEDER
jgi:hypothetical protein